VGETAVRDYPEELPVGYYLKNLQTLLGFVDSHYNDHLSADEKNFSQSFRSLSVDARRLYVRLISRKGPLFRKDQLVELVMAIPNQHEVRDYLRGLFHLYRPLKEREILVYPLLFFGNLLSGPHRVRRHGPGTCMQRILQDSEEGSVVPFQRGLGVHLPPDRVERRLLSNCASLFPGTGLSGSNGGSS